MGVRTARATALLLTALITCSAFAYEAVTVFGLPLAGKFEKKPNICPLNSAKSKTICWIVKPYVGKDGVRIGDVHLPDPDSRPAWAAYRIFHIRIENDGELSEIEFETDDSELRQVIERSISYRFGPPKDNSLSAPGTGSASWQLNDIFIRQMCSTEICIVSFRSRRLQNEVERQIADRKKKEALRPISP